MTVELIHPHMAVSAALMQVMRKQMGARACGARGVALAVGILEVCSNTRPSARVLRELCGKCGGCAFGRRR